MNVSDLYVKIIALTFLCIIRQKKIPSLFSNFVNRIFTMLSPRLGYEYPRFALILFFFKSCFFFHGYCQFDEDDQLNPVNNNSLPNPSHPVAFTTWTNLSLTLTFNFWNITSVLFIYIYIYLNRLFRSIISIGALIISFFAKKGNELVLIPWLRSDGIYCWKL